jgi:murein DD-endopeptidase MepM/ murein hydrolase activator NlpD
MHRRVAAAGIACVLLVAIGLVYGRTALRAPRQTARARVHEEPRPDELRDATSPNTDALHEIAPRSTRRSGTNTNLQRASTANLVTDVAAPRGHATANARATETSQNSVQASPSRSTSAEVAGPDGTLRRVEYRFGHAKSFQAALIQSGASTDEANELIVALQKVVDFRRGKPEDRFIFERDADQLLHTFEYRAGVTEVYRAVRNENGLLRGIRVDVPIERRRVAKGIFIAGTLGHSLDALGLGTSLAGTVTGAFDAKISFTRDTREGDSVKILLDEEYVDGVFLRYGPVHAIEYTSARAGKLQAFWFEAQRGDGEFFDPSGRALHGGWLRTPVRYDHVSSTYNLKRRHPLLKRIVPHLGIDYAANTGTPVWAAAEGLVTFAGPRGPNGNLVSIRHGHGFESHYAHLWKIGNGIKPGVKVDQRQVLGFVGSTGRSTGPHLHFALKRSGHFLDPVTQLNGPGEPLANSELPRFRALVDRLRAELDQVVVAAAPSVEGAPKVEEVEEEDDALDL